MRLSGSAFGLILASVALLASACSPPKAPGATTSEAAADPTGMVKALYQPYLTKGVNPPDWREVIPFSSATRELLRKEAAATAKTGEVGAIDGDPIVAAQDWDIKNLKVTVQAPPMNGKVVVDATFDNLDRSTTVSWFLVEEASSWRVENITEPELDLVKLISAPPT